MFDDFDRDAVEREGRFVGVLDMFGFEYFDHNGFEQLCINFANEKLQQLFADHVFKVVLDEYREEGVDVARIDAPNNDGVVKLIEQRGGVLSVLDEELRVPNGTDQGFADKAVAAFSSNAAFIPPKFGGPFRTVQRRLEHYRPLRPLV